jgi:hypothetical protein
MLATPSIKMTPYIPYMRPSPTREKQAIAAAAMANMPSTFVMVPVCIGRKKHAPARMTSLIRFSYFIRAVI